MLYKAFSVFWENKKKVRAFPDLLGFSWVFFSSLGEGGGEGVGEVVQENN